LNYTGLNAISIITISEQFNKHGNAATVEDGVKVDALLKAAVKTEKHVTSSVQYTQSVVQYRFDTGKNKVQE